MKLRVFSILLLSQTIFSGLFAAAPQEEGPVLVVSAHQKFLPEGAAEDLVNMVKMLTQAMLENFGPLGEVLIEFNAELTGNTPKNVIDAWDKSRIKWVREKALLAGYSQVVEIVGSDVEDKDFVKATVDSLFDEGKTIDLVTMVHAGDQWADVEFNGEFRLVHSEACNGAASLSDFRAQTALGHNGKSASPLYTFAFLSAWFNGKSVQDAAAFSKTVGESTIDNSMGFMFARALGGYDTQAEAKSESEITIVGDAELIK